MEGAGNTANTSSADPAIAEARAPHVRTDESMSNLWEELTNDAKLTNILKKTQENPLFPQVVELVKVVSSNLIPVSSKFTPEGQQKLETYRVHPECMAFLVFNYKRRYEGWWRTFSSEQYGDDFMNGISWIEWVVMLLWKFSKHDHPLVLFMAVAEVIRHEHPDMPLLESAIDDLTNPERSKVLSTVVVALSNPVGCEIQESTKFA